MEKLQAQSFQQPTDSLPARSPSVQSQALCPAQIAAERARLLFGCYRTGEANDPDTYTAAIASILCEYPMEVVQHVTDPRTGIARKIKFLPSIPEVDAACMEQAQWCQKRDELMRKGWRFECGRWIKPEEAA